MSKEQELLQVTFRKHMPQHNNPTILPLCVEQPNCDKDNFPLKNTLQDSLSDKMTTFHSNMLAK